MNFFVFLILIFDKELRKTWTISKIIKFTIVNTKSNFFFTFELFQKSDNDCFFFRKIDVSEKFRCDNVERSDELLMHIKYVDRFCVSHYRKNKTRNVAFISQIIESVFVRKKCLKDWNYELFEFSYECCASSIDFFFNHRNVFFLKSLNFSMYHIWTCFLRHENRFVFIFSFSRIEIVSLIRFTKK